MGKRERTRDIEANEPSLSPDPETAEEKEEIYSRAEQSRAGARGSQGKSSQAASFLYPYTHLPDLPSPALLPFLRGLL